MEKNTISEKSLYQIRQRFLKACILLSTYLLLPGSNNTNKSDLLVVFHEFVSIAVFVSYACSVYFIVSVLLDLFHLKKEDIRCSKMFKKYLIIYIIVLLISVLVKLVIRYT